MLATTGFTAITVEDVTERMLPMLHAFAVLGRFPYWLARIDKVVNALSGVEMYRHREAWRYNIYTATKP
jgi:sterol 24-C-methyltransferase